MNPKRIEFINSAKQAWGTLRERLVKLSTATLQIMQGVVGGHIRTHKLAEESVCESCIRRTQSYLTDTVGVKQFLCLVEDCDMSKAFTELTKQDVQKLALMHSFENNIEAGSNTLLLNYLKGQPAIGKFSEEACVHCSDRTSENIFLQGDGCMMICFDRECHMHGEDQPNE
jgi:hypothetical protein